MFSQYLSGIATVFMLHRVYPLESHKLIPNENLKVSPDYLDEFIVKAKAKGYSFISLDALYDDLMNNKPASKSIVLTLDDGYADNYTHAFPIFKKHNTPFAIYVTTSFPDNTAILWWYTLEDLIIQHDSIALNDGSSFECKTQEQKTDSFWAIRDKIIQLPKENFLDALQTLFKNYPVDWQSKVTEIGLNWQQIEELSKDPLATIGAHTINHFAAATLAKEELINEVMGSKQIIESHIHKPVDHFCYPFGSAKEVGEKEFAIVNELGFKTSTTTRVGSIFPEHKNHLSALPRVMLRNDFSLSRFELTAIKRLLQGRVVVA
jgi:peptidoglycan/xylan/chitin deacetylase (PgdA/CDA1 family)